MENKGKYINELTKKEIIEFLKENNLRLLNEDETKNNPYRRSKKEGMVLAICKEIEPDPIRSAYKAALFSLFPFVAMGPYSDIDEQKFVMIEDYWIYDALPLVDEEEKIKFSQAITANYVELMEKKFGKEYINDRNKWVEEVLKEEKELPSEVNPKLDTSKKRT